MFMTGLTTGADVESTVCVACVVPDPEILSPEESAAVISPHAPAACDVCFIMLETMLM